MAARKLPVVWSIPRGDRRAPVGRSRKLSGIVQSHQRLEPRCPARSGVPSQTIPGGGGHAAVVMGSRKLSDICPVSSVGYVELT